MEKKLYIGSFNNTCDASVLKCRFNEENGKIEVIDRLKAPRPSWLTSDGHGNLLFAMETAELDGREGGGIALASITADGITLKEKLCIGVKGPTHLTLYGGYIYASCYASGTLVEAGLNADGFTREIKLYAHEGKSVHPTRQNMPHPHFSLVTPDGSYLAVCDLGLDKIMLYPLAKGGGIAGKPREFAAPSGVGPRHAVFSKDGSYMYVVCEMGCNILTYSYLDGELTLLDSVSTLDGECEVASQCGAIRISNEGREIIVTNRGEDTVAFFSIGNDGRLSKNGSIRTAKWPRDCNLSPSGKRLLVAGQHSDTLEVYSYSDDVSLPLNERVKRVSVTSLNEGINPSSILFLD